jgi:lipoate-protein ligase A
MVPFERRAAALNMAVDDAISEEVGKGRALPTIRFYGWEPSAVTIGCFQNVRDEVDLDECSRQGVDVVRRRTGGGAVYHDQEGEITYSVIAPEDIMGDIPTSYREVCGWVIDALAQVGITAAFAPINDIVTAGRKISGCAQTRREGVFLQHGTVLASVDVGKMFSLLKVDPQKLTGRGIAAAEDRVTSVHTLTGTRKRELLEALEASFGRGKEIEVIALSFGERRRAAELVDARYGDPQWTFSR